MNSRSIFIPAFRQFFAGMILLVSFPLGAPAMAGEVADYLKKPDEWFVSPEGQQVAANILSWQAGSGGWPKNTDTADAPYTGERGKLGGTFDNGATTDELRFLARCVNEESLTADSAVQKYYLTAFNKGLRHILAAQYATGGWPQFFPPGKGYHRHITFNDDSMVRVMVFLREVHGSDLYRFVAPEDRKAAGAAFDRGIACILKCQIRVDGKPTVWCAQHDELDYSPRPARSFELASFSGSESVGITRLLMSIEEPGPGIVEAVEGAVAWFGKHKVTGLRAERRRTAGGEMDLFMQADPDAPPLWARFYDLESNKPFFCDRDGIKKPSILDLAPERRGGYAWYGTWAQSLLEKEYPKWKKNRG
ncbi:MAG: pectate lyase [Verrucomicrobiaceae bacterium]|nr:MAG: pectate lyase [Verrucomicrobiaceae bacterium]